MEGTRRCKGRCREAGFRMWIGTATRRRLFANLTGGPAMRSIEHPRIVHEMGVVTVGEAGRLLGAMRGATDVGRFFSAMSYFLTVGRKV